MNADVKAFLVMTVYYVMQYLISIHPNSGDPCPIDCDIAPAIKEGYYAVADATNHCYQWPGNSGENSMQSGTCNVEDQTFTYDQWTNCDCSGEMGARKTVPVVGCVIDNPPVLCQTVIDYSACEVDDKKDEASATYLRAD